MPYLTYDEYVELSDIGTITATSFSQAEYRARKRVDRMTYNRVAAMSAIPEDVKRCMVEIINTEAKIGVTAQVDNPLVTSFTTDGYQESHGNLGGLSIGDGAEKVLDRIVRTYLYGVLDDNGVPLIYRGCEA